MDSLILNWVKRNNKAKLKYTLEMTRGIVSVSGKTLRSDFEEMSDDTLNFLSVLAALWLAKKQS